MQTLGRPFIFILYIHTNLFKILLLRPKPHQKMSSMDIPQTQTVALVRNLGGEVEFKTDYPVPAPGRNEVLAKVLYTGVCQSGA